MRFVESFYSLTAVNIGNSWFILIDVKVIFCVSKMIFEPKVQVDLQHSSFISNLEVEPMDVLNHLYWLPS